MGRTWLHLLPLLLGEPDVLVVDARLGQDIPGDLGPAAAVEVDQLGLRHCEKLFCPRVVLIGE